MIASLFALSLSVVAFVAGFACVMFLLIGAGGWFMQGEVPKLCDALGRAPFDCVVDQYEPYGLWKIHDTLLNGTMFEGGGVLFFVTCGAILLAGLFTLFIPERPALGSESRGPKR